MTPSTGPLDWYASTLTTSVGAPAIPLPNFNYSLLRHFPKQTPYNNYGGIPPEAKKFFESKLVLTAKRFVLIVTFLRLPQ